MAVEKSQVGPIDEAARRQFEQFWAEGNPHPIEEFLPDETQHSYLPTLEELVLIDLEFSWRNWSIRQVRSREAEGETVVGPPHAETYIERFAALRNPEVVHRLVAEEISLRNRYGPPPHREEYQSRFPDVELRDTLFSGAGEPADETATGQAGQVTIRVHEETLPRTFGPYRLTEQIGAGGMGVVYRAWQEGVEREIAVKVLRTDRLAGLPPDHRQVLIDRFRTEARATARIDHPQIVNVFDVGEADGVPYYTMKYVTGASLGDGSAPLPEREAARIIQTVAAAVQAAHDHGILHRDLKPQNIIVEESSQTPFVADFGLAKLLEDESSQTVTGEILGTPQYMPPEQAQDSGSVTTHSDVYALGATLYYLLTGEPPFPGKSHLEILQKVLDKAPAPPRQLNPDLDSDLEVICLKCLEKDPRQRYASARELADDLSSWLSGDPIAARPPGRWERVRRWCRKNPLPSSLAAVAVFSVVFGVVALGVGYSSEARGREEAESARDIAQKERDNAEASFRQAHNAVNDFFTTTSEDVLLAQPGMQPLRRDLLEKALDHYNQFLEDRQDDPELRAELGLTHYRVGVITEALVSSEAALTPYRRAEVVQRRLHLEQPEDAEFTRDLSTTLNALGVSLTRLGDADAAFGAFQEARALRQSLVDRDGENAEYRRLLASTVMNIGSVHRMLNQFGDAQQHYETSIEMRTDLLQGNQSPSQKILRDQGKAYFNLGNLENDQVFMAHVADNAALLTLAAEHLERAIEFLARVAQPDDFNLRYQIVDCFAVLGEIRIRQQDFFRATESYATALKRMRELAIENPRVVQYQVRLGGILQLVGQLTILHEGDWEGALELYIESCDRLRDIVESESATPQATSNLVQALLGLADVHLEREERALALETAEEALKYAQQLTAEFPAEDWYAQQLRDVRKLIGVIEALSP